MPYQTPYWWKLGELREKSRKCHRLSTWQQQVAFLHLFGYSPFYEYGGCFQCPFEGTCVQKVKGYPALFELCCHTCCLPSPLYCQCPFLISPNFAAGFGVPMPDQEKLHIGLLP